MTRYSFCIGRPTPAASRGGSLRDSARISCYIRYCWMSTILLLPVYLTYWPRKCVTCFSPHGEISTKFEVWSWYDHQLPIVIAFLLLIHYVTLWPWPFDLVQWSYMAGYMINPSSKFEAPTAICPWVMSSDTSTLNTTLTTYVRSDARSPATSNNLCFCTT